MCVLYVIIYKKFVLHTYDSGSIYIRFKKLIPLEAVNYNYRETEDGVGSD